MSKSIPLPNLANKKSFPLSISHLCLFLGLFFSTATKLRFPQIPLGLSDVFFLLFSVMAYIQDELEWRSKKNLYFLLVLLCCFLLSNAGGYITSYKNSSFYSFSYDSLSFLYVSVFTFLFLTYKKSLDILVKYLVLSGVFGATFYYVFMFFCYDFFCTSRFSFLSVNPNQFALFLAPIPFFILNFLNKDEDSKLALKNIWIIVLGICFFCALVNRSFALILSWVMIFGLILADSVKKILSQHVHFIVLYGISGGFVIGLVSFCYYFFRAIETGNFGDSFIYQYIWQIPSEFYIRLEIWENLIAESAKGGLLFGYGPGAQTKVNAIHHLPPQEAHNIFLSILYQGGILSLCAALYGLYFIVQKMIYSNKPYLFCAFLSILFLAFLHSPIRMPIFWFYLIYIYKSCKEKVE